jgi:RND family efflux transporter MFP subunit
VETSKIRPTFLPFGTGLLLAVILGLAGCSRGRSGAGGAEEPPPVTVSYPLYRSVTDHEDYTGRTAAVDAVQVRARVTGYLERINFKEGAEVKEGDVLYQIDPRPYQAVVDQAEAQVRLNEAQHTYAEAVYARNVRLSTTEAVSREELQQSLAQRSVTQAQVNASKATLAQGRLNLGWTKVTSPINGRIGRTLVTRGNLVTADQTVLTSVVSQDPMYVYFKVDEPTVLHIQQLIREGRFHSVREEGSRPPVFIGLASEKGCPHEGYVDFINNQVSTATATLQVRGVFKNAKPSRGPRLLAPGMWVRIRVPIGTPYQALLVTQAAIGTDQNVQFVYVVNEQDEVVRRNVTLGTEHEGLVVVRKGVEAGDRVVVEGLQHVHPDVKVAPSLVPMPVPETQDMPRAAVTTSPPPASPAKK